MQMSKSLDLITSCQERTHPYPIFDCTHFFKIIYVHHWYVLVIQWRKILIETAPVVAHVLILTEPHGNERFV